MLSALPTGLTIYWRLSKRRAYSTCDQDGWGFSPHLHIQSGGRAVRNEVVHVASSLTFRASNRVPFTFHPLLRRRALLRDTDFSGLRPIHHN